MGPKAYIFYSAAVILQALANGYCYGFDIMDIARASKIKPSDQRG